MKWKEPSRMSYQIVREGAQRGFFWRGRDVIGFETQEAKSGDAAA